MGAVLMFQKMSKRLSTLLLPVFLLTLPLASNVSLADAKADSGKELTTLYRAARKVISKNQGLINEKRSGKKLTADYVIKTALINYKDATGHKLDMGNDPMGGKKAMLDAVRSVMEEAQDLINDSDVGFKGFLPAIFARQVGTAFGKNTGGKITIKLTAPKKYVRNRSNRPDKWEKSIISGMFAKSDYAKGKPHFENTKVKGKAAFRYILPEYYSESCLSCHGTPKGSLDITGGKKEGGVLGELGGAISLTIYK